MKYSTSKGAVGNLCTEKSLPKQGLLFFFGCDGDVLHQPLLKIRFPGNVRTQHSSQAFATIEVLNFYQQSLGDSNCIRSNWAQKKARDVRYGNKVL